MTTARRLLLCGAAAAAGACASASDWPQFMCDSAHTGDAASETLALPLGLVAQGKLDDAVLTAPAVVNGLAYVVDQMGAASCLDPASGAVYVCADTVKPTADRIQFAKHETGKVPALSMAWPTDVAVSDDYAYVNDTLADRVVRVRLGVAAEETVRREDGN